MMRAYLPLVCAVVFATMGAGSVFSQTALEQFDRAQKELQTRYDAKRSEKPDAENSTTYNLQNALETMRQARELLLAGNESTAIQQLAQLQSAGNSLPSETKLLLDGTVQQLRTERAARQAAFTKEVDEACQRATEVVPKAREPKDLDATLRDFARIADLNPTSRSGEYETNRASARLQAAVAFVNRWQDYLLARNRNNENKASSFLRSLAESTNQQPILIPRSVILALQPQTDSDTESSPPSRRSARPRAQIEAAAVEIVGSVKKLEDVPAALSKIEELRKEITSQQSYAYNSDSDLGVAFTGLQALQRAFLELQNGVATTILLGSNRPDYNPRPDIENALLPLRAQLLKLAAPRLLNAPADEKPTDGETLDASLRRLIESAKKRQDWDAVVRGLELKHTLATSAPNSYAVSNDQEVTAFKNFFAGRNLEQAAQYQQAVISYLTALRSGQQDLPATSIGEHLAAIEKAHPADYAAGASYVLNPPPSPYGDFPRFGSPMSRSPFDPRFPARPGSPGVPVDERLSVPAALLPSPPVPGKPLPDTSHPPLVVSPPATSTPSPNP